MKELDRLDTIILALKQIAIINETNKKAFKNENVEYYYSVELYSDDNQRLSQRKPKLLGSINRYSTSGERVPIIVAEFSDYQTLIDQLVVLNNTKLK